jgi:hypothetical protein
MMDLQRTLTKGEVADILTLDFLEDIPRKDILRVDELHPTIEDDSYYIYNIWCDPETEIRIVADIHANIRKLDDAWKFKVQATGAGFITVFTYV